MTKKVLPLTDVPDLVREGYIVVLYPTPGDTETDVTVAVFDKDARFVIKEGDRTGAKIVFPEEES